MGYRMEYRQPTKGFPLRLPFFIVFSFLIFLILVYQRWPEGAAVIRAMCSEWKNSGAVSALNRFAGDLVKGEQVRQAFSNFLDLLQS